MLDIKRIREDFEGVKKAVEFRGKGDVGLDNVKKYDEERRALLAEVEAMKNRQNTVSREIPKMKKEGQDTSEIMAEMRELSKAIKEMDGRLSEIEENLKIALLGVPNTPYKEVQYGEDDSANVELRRFHEPTAFDFEPKAHWDIGEDLDILDFRVEEKEHDRIEVFTKHEVDGYKAELNLSDESSGTKKLFRLLPFIAESLIDGTTLVIDELDAKIHPVLLRHIIMLYNDMEVNRKGAQLIFTSHDLSTMNSEVFRRDEIWFVAKGNGQNSKLYSLVEFKNSKGESVRKDAKFDKQYLEGKYGADPYLRKIIDWGTVNA